MVLDINVLVSAFWGGVPQRVIKAWLKGRYLLLVSPPILMEYHATLERLLPASPAVARFLHALYLKTLAIHPKERVHVIHQDPSDD